MIAAPAWLLSNWRAIGALVVVGGMGLAILYYRGEAALAEVAAARAETKVVKAEKDLVEMTGAYNLLAQSVQRQNAAMNDLEAQGKEAAARGARARREAAGVVDVAIRHADALGRRMSEPAQTSCPAGEGLEIVRADLRGTLR